jgi:hypothetical protein
MFKPFQSSMTLRFCTPVLALLLGCTVSAVAADLSGEERLAAIREALVEAALKSTTHVSATSWMESDGVLKEYNRFNSDVKVRDLEVKISQAADQSAKADVVAKQTQVQAPDACSAPMAKHKLSHVMTFGVNVSSDLPAAKRYRGQQIERYALDRILAAASANPSWRLVFAPRFSKAYEREVYSHGEQDIQLHLQLTISSAPMGRTVDEMGAFTMSWKVVSPVQPRPRWEYSDVIASPVMTKAVGSNTLNADTLDAIDQAILRVVGQLDSQLNCEPPSFTVVEDQGRLLVKAGKTAGLRVGDKLVLANSELLPQRALEAGAIGASMLAEVKSVSDYQSEVKPVTKRVKSVDGAWLAWPYTY